MRKEPIKQDLETLFERFLMRHRDLNQRPKKSPSRQPLLHLLYLRLRLLLLLPRTPSSSEPPLDPSQQTPQAPSRPLHPYPCSIRRAYSRPQELLLLLLSPRPSTLRSPTTSSRPPLRLPSNTQRRRASPRSSPPLSVESWPCSSWA